MRCPTGIRNAALMVLLYRSGLRISEALDLLVKDVDLNRCMVRVLHGKGDKARTAGLDKTVVPYIDGWLARRASLGISDKSTVFYTIMDRKDSPKGSRMAQTYVRAAMRRKAAKLGFQKRLHPHGLRHTHAFELSQEGVPINVIQRQLGHSNSAITSGYIDHINPKQVVDATSSRQWA